MQQSHYSKNNLEVTSLYSVKPKKKNRKKKPQEYICLKTYLDPEPLNEEERKLINSICSDSVYYKPRKILKTEFVGIPEKYEVFGFQSSYEYHFWLKFQRLDNPSYHLDIDNLFHMDEVGSE